MICNFPNTLNGRYRKFLITWLDLIELLFNLISFLNLNILFNINYFNLSVHEYFQPEIFKHFIKSKLRYKIFLNIKIFKNYNYCLKYHPQALIF